MKKSISVIFLLFLGSKLIFSQKVNYFIGLDLKYGMLQQNYSVLDKYDHLLGSPSNYNFSNVSTAAHFGLKDKFYLTISISSGFSKNMKGNYLNNDITVSNSKDSYGLSLGLPIYKKEFLFVKRMYASVGVKHFQTNITSFKTNVTSYYYEASAAKTYVGNAEIRAEMFDRHPKTLNSALITFFVAAGYNFQLSKVKWSGECIRIPGDESPQVKLGGLYFDVGCSLWFGKTKKN